MSEGATPFELLLFSTERAFVCEAVDAGVDGIVVDWETLGKRRRQAGADTEVNCDTLEDLQRVRSWVDVPVLCRVNSPGPTTERELESAIAAGADEVLVPMVRSPRELEWILELVHGRCAVGALIETTDAVDCAADLARLPLSRLYVGLNDLAIERRTPSIFTALGDGTVARVRSQVDGRFGFAGLTDPERGHPIPCRLLVGELVRLRSTFSFLRRSYRRDARSEQQVALIARLRSALLEAGRRSADEVEQDRRELEDAIAAWPWQASAHA